MFELQSQDGVMRLTMAYGKVNLMDIEFCRALIQQLDELESGDCRAVVLTGNSKAFSAGVDLKRWLAEGPEYVTPFLEVLEGVMERIFVFAKPIVAAIHGPAVAGGCMMASACDYRLITPTAKIGIPEMRVGVPLPMMAIEIMRFVANPAAFQSVVNVGAMYTGSNAVATGLANEMVGPNTIQDRAAAVAQDFAAIPREAFQFTKRQCRTPVLRIVAANRAEFHEEFLKIWCSPETRKAVQMYVDDRLS